MRKTGLELPCIGGRSGQHHTFHLPAENRHEAKSGCKKERVRGTRVFKHDERAKSDHGGVYPANCKSPQRDTERDLRKPDGIREGRMMELVAAFIAGVWALFLLAEDETLEQQAERLARKEARKRRRARA